MAGFFFWKARTCRETAIDIELFEIAIRELRLPEAVGLDGDIGDAQAAVDDGRASLFRTEWSMAHRLDGCLPA